MLRGIKAIVTLVFLAQSAWLSAQSLVINEVSQGSGSAEYVELLVTGPISCGTPSCLDIRLWIFDDNNGNFAPGSGTGIAAGACRFADDPFWSCIPAGTKIVIYNDNCSGCPNSSIPPIDLSYLDGDCQIVIPVSSALFDKHTSLPHSSNPAYSGTGWVSGGSWTNISMNNSNDSFQILDPANTGAPVHSVSWGNNTTGTIISFAGPASGQVFSMMNVVDNDPNNQANWVSGSVPVDETPGINNGVANDAWITAMNYTCNPITADTTFADVVCPGACDGQASVNVTGGVLPYMYLWTPGNMTGATEVGLCPGTYQIVVYDFNNCTDTTSVIISEPPPLVLNLISTTDASCGNNNGEIVVSGSGGIPALTYSIDNITFQGSGTFTGLAAGTYTLYMEDTNGCPITISVTLNNVAGVTATEVTVDITCNGANDGQVTIAAANGLAPYQYALDGGALGAPNVFAGLTPGAHSVLVQDASGCTTTVNFTINEPPAVTLSGTVTHASCNGLGNGTIMLAGGGGTPGYQYSIDGNPLQASNVFAALFGGSYTMLVSDANGCTTTIVLVVLEPAPILTTLSPLNAQCFGLTGSIPMTVSGGTMPYTFLWNNGGLACDLPPGTPPGCYVVTVTDANGCVVQDSACITEPPQIVAIDSVIDISCAGAADGEVYIVASGGSGALQYSLDGGPLGATASFTGLGPGAHTIEVQDASNCFITMNITVTEPLPLTGSVTVTNVSCNGSADGELFCVVLNGTFPYTYTWFTGSVAATATGLPAGNYCVVVTDANGCAITICETVAEPPIIVVTTLIADAACGAADGSITVTATGGDNGPYTYSLDGGGFGPANVFTNLAAGSYTIDVNDASGCSAVQTIVPISNLAAPIIDSVQTTEPSCVGATDGGVTIFASGGGGYQYAVNGGALQGSNVFAGLGAGTHSIMVEDVAGCQLLMNVILTDPIAITFTDLVVDLLCYQDLSGSITITASGGGGNYQYSFDGGTLQVSNTFNNLSAGTFPILIEDGAGCQGTGNVTIAEPIELVISTLSTTNLSCYAACDGTAIVVPGGGPFAGSYTYSWSNPLLGNAAAVSALCAGQYTITIFDDNNCSVDSTITILQPLPFAVVTSVINSNCNQAVGVATVDAVSGGNAPYTFQWDGAAGSGVDTFANALIPGTYQVTITDANLCDTVVSIIVGNIAGMTASLLASTDVICFQFCDGYAEVNVLGGVAPLTYLWDNAAVTPDVNTLCAGAHFCVITDASGCFDTVFVSITEPTELLITVSNDTMICSGSTINLNANASGGSPNYTFDWNSGQFTGPSISDNPTVLTSYTVIATDFNGCPSASATVNVDLHPQLQLSTFGDVTICEGETVGIGALVSSGYGNYYYTWDVGLGTASAGNVTPSVTTSYTVSVADDCNLLPLQGQVTVTVNPVPQIAFTADEFTGCAPFDVTFSNTSGVPGMNCFWDFGDGANSTDCSSASHTYTQPGTYMVSFTFNSPTGCIGIPAPDIVIVISDYPVADFVASPQPATMSSPLIHFEDLSTDAALYNWDFAGLGTSGEASPDFVFPAMEAGEYQVCLEVTNTLGCTDEVCDTVMILDEFTLYVPNAFTPDGDGINDFFFPVMKSVDASDYEFQIYNRWGERIFQAFNPDHFWDGHVAGQMAKQDVYVWRLSLRAATSNDKHIYVGHVSLIR
jgi:gliding motility-associated-like protein